MPVVGTWDWNNRLIYLAEANYDPIDIYREHRALRATDENARKYKPMVKAIGGLPKGGGERFGNALQMLDGAKIIPLDGSGVNTLSGEIVTDNPDVDPDPFDSTSLSNPPRIVTSPISVIQTVNTGSGVTEQDKADIIDGVWSKLLSDLQTNGTTGKTLREIHNFLGLDPSDPIAIERTRIISSLLTILITGDDDIKTLTRQ